MSNTNHNNIDFELIDALHETVDRFTAQTSLKITLIDGVLWPLDANSPIDIVGVAKQLTSQPHSGLYGAPINEVVKQLHHHIDADYGFSAGLLGEDGYIIFFRGKNQQDILEAMEHYSIQSREDYMHFAGFIINHELFHSFDHTVFDGDKISKKHRREFFCDFAACLKMKSEGIDVFLDIAKMRALSMLSNQTNLYAKRRSITPQDTALSFSYANHHIYAAYKEWEHENPDVDVRTLKAIDIALIARDVTYRRALSGERLKNHIEHSTHIMPRDRSPEGDDLYKKRTRRLKTIQNRPIGNWQDDYRREVTRPSTINVSPLIRFVNK